MVNEFFGRVSMAAGFVFLSGLVAGAVYGKFADDSMVNCSKVAARRALYIHKYHVTTFVFLCLVVLLVPQYVDDFKFDWIREFPEAGRKVVKFIFLGYQPKYFDILPLYALFVLAMPLAFFGFKKGHAVTVMAVSFGLWIFAQLGIVDDRVFGGSVFNPLAWQILYFTGLYFGYYQLHKQQEIVRPQRSLIVICFSIVVLGFCLRWNLGSWPEYVQTETFLSNKPNHSILYLINFYAFAYLVCCVAQRFPALIIIRPFVFLGKHSIQVFSFHILVVYLTLPLMSGARHMAPWMGVSLGLLIVGSLFIPAKIHQRYRENSGRKRNQETRTGWGSILNFLTR